MAYFSADEQQALDAKFARYQRCRERSLRNELIEAHRALARYFARRYNNRGEPYDDLLQVAYLGLLKSVERFDPERGLEFSTFAGVTIEGELKRHFRDRTWSIRVPRDAQELHLRIRPTTNRLAQELGRTPTVPELAADLDVTEEDVLQAMEVGGAYRSASLDARQPDQTVASDIERALGVTDGNFALAEHRVVIDELLATLPERERTIVALRFYDELTQNEIAERVGMSQMHVSRLLARSLDTLRALLAQDATA